MKFSFKLGLNAAVSMVGILIAGSAWSAGWNTPSFMAPSTNNGFFQMPQTAGSTLAVRSGNNMIQYFQQAYSFLASNPEISAVMSDQVNSLAPLQSEQSQDLQTLKFHRILEEDLTVLWNSGIIRFTH